MCKYWLWIVLPVVSTSKAWCQYTDVRPQELGVGSWGLGLGDRHSFLHQMAPLHQLFMMSSFECVVHIWICQHQPMGISMAAVSTSQSVVLYLFTLFVFFLLTYQLHFTLISLLLSALFIYRLIGKFNWPSIFSYLPRALCSSCVIFVFWDLFWAFCSFFLLSFSLSPLSLFPVSSCCTNLALEHWCQHGHCTLPFSIICLLWVLYSLHLSSIQSYL